MRTTPVRPDDPAPGPASIVSKTGIAAEMPTSFEQAFVHYHTAVIITNHAGRMLGCNQAAIDIFGNIPPNIRPNEWIHHFGLHQADGTKLPPAYELPLFLALRGENAEEIFFKDGPASAGTWISLSAKPLLTANGLVSGAMVFINEISHGRHVADLREKNKRLADASFTISQQIAEIGNHPRQILNKVVEFAAETIGDGCIASLLNVSADRLRVVAYHHIRPDAHEVLSRSGLSREYKIEGMIEQVIRTGKPLLIPVFNQENLRKTAQPDQVEYVEKVGVNSLLVVPIKGRTGILGTMSLVKDRGGSQYTDDDQTFMMDVAYRMGLAIDASTLIHSLRLESFGRQKAERALEISEVRFRSIYTSTALSIKLLDLTGNILETNPAFQKMLNYSDAEIKGKPIATFLHPLDAPRMLRIIDSLKEDLSQSFQVEHRLLKKDRSLVWVSATLTGIKINDQEESEAFIVAISENITRRKLMEAEMAEMKARLHSHIEMERLQLARELHDGPLQDLYSSIYKIENVNNLTDPEKVHTLKQDLEKVIHALRNTAKNLRPPALANFGLEKAIRSHAEEISESNPGLQIHLNLAPDMQVLPEDIRLILFRIYQNSISNILRHARASEISVRFSFDAEEAQLEISDNGIGFAVPDNWVDLVRKGHYGLAGAVERVSLMDGTFMVESSPGAGTTIRVVLPMKENDTIE